MEEKFNEATSQQKQDQPLDAPLASINIPVFIEQLKQGPTWKERDRSSITVFKTNGMRIVLIGLRAGTEMAKHIANGPISIQVLEGQIKFTADDRSVELSKGQMLALHQNIPHSVLAMQETIFLLTLATTLSGKE
jgi:quercetin dioxygenase-like cupin family protein